MDLTEELKEARYVRRGENGPYLEDVGQCGFGCDHSKLLNNDDSPRPCYRVCNKFKIRVSDYDSCKYFSNNEFMELIRMYTVPGKKSPVQEKPQEKPKKSGAGWLWVLVLLALVYILIKNI